MLMQSHDNLKLLHFELLHSCDRFVHAITTRLSAGEQNSAFNLAWSSGERPDPVRRRIRLVAGTLNTDPDCVCCARQVHGASIACIDELPEADIGAPCRMCGEHDALITDRPGIMLLIRVADCVPIVLYDPVRRVAAAVHAGWKGTVANIAAATVACMTVRYGCRAGDILAGIGPAIGPCCFEVGEEVAAQFVNALFEGSVERVTDGTRVDLPGANRTALLRAGLQPDNIEMSGYCTSCSLDIFFSHRGEQGDTGRFGLFAGQIS